MGEPVTKETMDKRLQWRTEVFTKASALIEPLVEKHGIEDHQDGGAVFARGVTVTAIDQHLDHIMRVADWLMIREE